MGLFETKKKSRHQTKIDFSTLSDYQASPNPTALPPQAALGSAPTSSNNSTQIQPQSQPLPTQPKVQGYHGQPIHQQVQQTQPNQQRNNAPLSLPGSYHRATPGPPIPPRTAPVVASAPPQVVFVPIPINTQAYGYPSQVMSQPYYQGQQNQLYMQVPTSQQHPHHQYSQKPPSSQQRPPSHQQTSMMGQSPNRQVHRVGSSDSTRSTVHGSSSRNSSANGPSNSPGRIATSPYRNSGRTGSNGTNQDQRNEFLNRAQQPESRSTTNVSRKTTESERSIYSSPTSMGFERSTLPVSPKLRVPTINLDRDDDRRQSGKSRGSDNNDTALDKYMDHYFPGSSFNKGSVDLMYEIKEIGTEGLNSQNRSLQIIYKSLLDEDTRTISPKLLRSALLSRHGGNTDLRVAENLIDYFGNKEIGFEFANFVKLCKFLHKCKVSFDYTDADQSGYLDFQEFLQCLEDNKFYIDEKQAFALYDNIPRKKNQLGIYEYISVILFILHQRKTTGGL